MAIAAAGGPRPLGLAGLAFGLGSSAALTFLIVDCEATMFGLQVLGCESPRLLTPAQSPTGLGLNILFVAVGYLAIATLALFALAALLHAAQAALAGAPSSRKDARHRKDAKSSSAPAAAPPPSSVARKQPALASRPVGQPGCTQRTTTNSQSPIVSEQGLQRFLLEKAGHAARQAAPAAHQLPSPAANQCAAAGTAWGSAPLRMPGASPVPGPSPGFPGYHHGASRASPAGATCASSPFGASPTSPFVSSPFVGSPFGAAPAFSPAPFSGSAFSPAPCCSVLTAPSWWRHSLAPRPPWDARLRL